MNFYDIFIHSHTIGSLSLILQNLSAILPLVTASKLSGNSPWFPFTQRGDFLKANDYQMQQPASSFGPLFLWIQGAASSKAECILEILSDLGKVPLRIQEQILHQTSFFQLDRWFLLARQVRSVEEFINRM